MTRRHGALRRRAAGRTRARQRSSPTLRGPLHRVHAAHDRLRRRPGAADRNARAGHARAPACAISQGDTLEQDLAWTFETEAAEPSAPSATDRGSDDESTPAAVRPAPETSVTANAAVDAVVAGRARNADRRRTTASVVTAALEAQPTPYPGRATRKSSSIRRSTPGPTICGRQRDLRAGTKYALQIEPGVEPLYGNVATTKRFTRRDPHLRRARDRADAGAEPQQRRPLRRRRSGRSPSAIRSTPKSIAGAVTISPAPAR